MLNDGSDVEDFYDVESPLSTSVYGTTKRPSVSSSPTKYRSTDRLYSIAASHRHVLPDSESTSLLGTREGRGNYLSTSLLEPSNFDPGTSSAQPLGVLTRKISRVFQSKAYDYDSNKQSLAAVGSGERVWYVPRLRKALTVRIGDYRTIDWVHDSVKDQFRKKKLRNMTGIRGVIVNALDAIEGWVLVGLIGTGINTMNL